MNKLRQLTAPARFSASDLTGWTTKDLSMLLSSSQVTQNKEKITTFRQSKEIKFELNPAEMALITDLKRKHAENVLTSCVDVHGYYLNSGPCSYSESGLTAVEKQKVGGQVPVLIEPALWMAPVDLICSHPGAQWLVGLSMTLLKREEGKVVVFFDQKAYLTL